jgi:hypothetical protein
VLAGFDELLGFAQSLSVDEHNLLLFRCWVEEVAIHNERFKSIYPCFPTRSAVHSESVETRIPVIQLRGDSGPTRFHFHREVHAYDGTQSLRYRTVVSVADRFGLFSGIRCCSRHQSPDSWPGVGNVHSRVCRYL